MYVLWRCIDVCIEDYLQDGAEYLFACSTEADMHDWVAKINFHAQLSPQNQLTKYGGQRSGEVGFCTIFL